MGFGAMRRDHRRQRHLGPARGSANAKLLLRRALELGINFFDTADSYGRTASESFIAETLYPFLRACHRHQGGLVRPSRRRWDPTAAPSTCRLALDRKLKRLEARAHRPLSVSRPDPQVTPRRPVGALAEAQRAGKIRHLGSPTSA